MGTNRVGNAHLVVKERVGSRILWFGWRREMPTRERFPCWKKFHAKSKGTPFVLLVMLLRGPCKDLCVILRRISRNVSKIQRVTTTKQLSRNPGVETRSIIANGWKSTEVARLLRALEHVDLKKFITRVDNRSVNPC